MLPPYLLRHVFKEFSSKVTTILREKPFRSALLASLLAGSLLATHKCRNHRCSKDLHKIANECQEVNGTVPRDRTDVQVETVSKVALDNEFNKRIAQINLEQGKCARYLIDIYTKETSTADMARSFVNNDGSINPAVQLELPSTKLRQYKNMGCILHQSNMTPFKSHVENELLAHWGPQGIKQVSMDFRYYWEPRLAFYRTK